MDVNEIKQLAGDKTYKEALWLQEQHALEMSDSPVFIPDTDENLYTGEANDADDKQTYDFEIVLSASHGTLIRYDCNCFNAYIFPDIPCRHVTAGLLHIANPPHTLVAETPTDASMVQLLTNLSTSQLSYVDNQEPVSLQAIFSRASDNKLKVGFKLGYPDKRMYVIQNITEFMDAIKRQEKVKYGKELEFIHSLQNFTPDSHSVLRFLADITNDEDSYKESSGSYYAYYANNYYGDNTLRRHMFLKGRYLDAFMDALGDLPVYYAWDTINYEQLAISDLPIALNVQLTRSNNAGYFLSGSIPDYFKGNTHLYFLDRENKTIHKTPIYSYQFLMIVEYLYNNSGKDTFISTKDLPAFSQYLFPILSTRMLVTSDGFDPLDYAPEDPVFEIYLDMPQEDLITGSLHAVYSSATYDVLEGIKPIGRRNVAKEKEMDAFFSRYFNSFDNLRHIMALSDDDEKLYHLLKTGISEMQEKAIVYISDALKKLTILPAPKVAVGVSITHDLLNLDLVSDDINLRQLAEVLGRYDRKKKFYRFKNGSFLDIDDSLEDLQDLAQDLSLTMTQIVKGNIQIPSFRALYVNEMASEASFPFDRDDSFRTLIDNMGEKRRDHFIPPTLKDTLLSYQKEGFEWLCKLKDNGFSALLADEMGLGKTLQVIAFLSSCEDRGKTLIVCPASLVYNWYYEFKRFMPELPVKMITGNANERQAIIQNSEPSDILVTSYDLLKRDIQCYEPMQFYCEVIDEAQYIKNFATQASRAVKQIHSSFRIALTGTPIENRLSELWSIFDYLMPGFFFSYPRFRSEFEVPIVRDQSTLIEEQLQKMIAPFVLRRLKKDVMKQLPDKLEEVYYAPLEEEQKELYDARVQRLKLMLEKQSDKDFKENKLLVLAELTRLRQTCCDPSLIYEDYKGNSSKRDLCLNLIHQAIEGGHKILLFSQFTSMLEELTIDFQSEGIPYHLLTGDTPKQARANMVQSFQSDNVPVFCISLKAGGTGLNLTAADIVIHYDPWWNTAVENQASDRAHRIGQTNVVNVYKLIVKDTVEERILQLQQEKSDLADRILTGEGMSSSSLSREDLLHLL